MLMELRFVKPNGALPDGWGMRNLAEGGRQWRAHRWRSLGRAMCDMVNPGKRRCVVGDEGEQVECAGDLGNDAGEAANPPRLVRESGSVSVSVRVSVRVSVSGSLQATLAYIRGLVVCAPAGGFVQMAWQAP
jgi:hypothetical protein